MLGVESKGGGVRDGNVTERFRSFPTSTFASGCGFVYGCRHEDGQPASSPSLGAQRAQPTCSIKHWKGSIPGPYRAPVQ
jgi:hypothetical protein